MGVGVYYLLYRFGRGIAFLSHGCKVTQKDFSVYCISIIDRKICLLANMYP